MNRLLITAVLLSSVRGIAQSPRLVAGSTVFIEAGSGYESYLAAAIYKQRVDLVLVTERGRAQFVIKSQLNQTAPRQDGTVIINGNQDAFSNGWNAGQKAANKGSISVGITIEDVASSRVVFADSVKHSGQDSYASVADEEAKHLKRLFK